MARVLTGPRNVGLRRQPAMDADNGSPRRGLASPVDMLLRGFETTVYAIGFVLLVAAAVLVVIGAVVAVIQSATLKATTLEGTVLVLDRILLVLIIAELAYTIRSVHYHGIAAEPFLFIGLIATIRRIIIVTAALEQPQSNEALNRLLLQLGGLALLVLAIAAAIFMIRFSAKQASQPPDTAT
jgi:uncharacterized membrane protein (DUF373 family)